MILLTGANGNLGNYVRVKLKDEKVRLLIKQGDTIKNVSKNHEVVHADITQNDTLKNVTKNIKTVIHLAGLVDYNASRELLFEVNMLGTKNILSHCTNVNKFIHLSSTSVYGRDLPKTKIDETYPTNPITDYAMSKAMAENDVINSGIDYVILRSCDIYGKNFNKGYFQILKMINKNKMFIVGKGNNKLPFIHAKDVAEAIVLSIHKGKGIYNLAPANPLTQSELYAIVAEKLSKPVPKLHLPSGMAKILMKIQAKGRTKELNEYIHKLSSDRLFNITKIEHDLKFKETISINNGIQKMIDYYMEMKDNEN